MADGKPGKIEQRAYEIWEREGRPHGKALEHWHQAVAEVAREEEKGAQAKTAGAGKKAPKTKKAASKPATKTSGAKTSGAKQTTKTKTAAKTKKTAAKTKG